MIKRASIFTTLIIFLLYSTTTAAQEKKTIPSKLTEATVFFHGAELVHSAAATLVKGDNEIYIEGFSPSIDVNSLKIKASNSVLVSAFEFSIDYLSAAKDLTPALKKIEDSISVYRNTLDKVTIDHKINANMISHLQAGISKNVSGSEKGLGIDELMKTMDYYKSKSEEMETTQAALNKKKGQLENAMKRLQQQLDQESMKGNKTLGVLRLHLSAPAAGNAAFMVSYYTVAAGWMPYYDINIAATDKPVILAVKSKVRQTTGLDWERVKLNLSTATPSNGKTAPLFSVWFLEQRQYKVEESQDLMMQNSVSYERSAPAAQSLAAKSSDITIRGSGTISQGQAPMIVINGRPASQEEYNSLESQMIKSISVLKNEQATALYGAKAANGVIIITLKSEMDDYVSTADNALNVVYNIDIPYSIPGNGKEQSIDLQKKETPAAFKYYCAPKLDTETYLLAEISDWEKLGLLNGKANLTYDGTYIGETFINSSSTQEKLALTLGTDKRVTVKREKMQDFSSVKFLGSDVLQVFTYKLTVKNNQNKPVKMVLKDQYPISTQKDIEVVLRKETTPWTANKEDLGVITWEEEFAAGETKTYQISYSVKYPKGMDLNL